MAPQRFGPHRTGGGSRIALAVKIIGILTITILGIQAITFGKLWWTLSKKSVGNIRGENPSNVANQNAAIPGLLWGQASFEQDNLDYSPTFPRTAQTLKDLRLCDTEKMIQLSGAFQCESDPTCEECVASLVHRNRKLTSEFNKDISTDPMFVATMQSLPKEVVLLTVNAGQAYLLVNWYRSVVKNVPQLDICAKTLVVTTDLNAQTQIESNSCLKVLKVSITNLHISENYKINKANSGAHAVINNLLFLVTNYLVQNDKYVLLHDVDQVWLRDPFPLLHKLATGSDTACMASKYIETSKGFCNTGFVYILPSARSKILWASVIQAMDVKKNSDQQLFNMVIKHHHFREYNVRVLPYKEFNSRAVRRAFDETETLVYHAVSVNKKQQLIEIGQWFVNPSEDPEADDEAGNEQDVAAAAAAADEQESKLT